MCGLGVERMQKRKAEQYPFMTCYHHFSGYSIRSQYISPWQSSLRSHPSVENTEIISIKFLSEIFTAINATYRCHKEWLVKMLNWNSAHTERNKNLPQNSFSSTHTTLLNAMRPTTMAGKPSRVRLFLPNTTVKEGAHSQARYLDEVSLVSIRRKFEPRIFGVISTTADFIAPVIDWSAYKGERYARRILYWRMRGIGSMAVWVTTSSKNTSKVNKLLYWKEPTQQHKSQACFQEYSIAAHH